MVFIEHLAGAKDCVKPWRYGGRLPHDARRPSGASQSHHHSPPCSLQRKRLLCLLGRVQAPEQPYSGACWSEPRFLHCRVGILLPAFQECT